MPVCAGYNCHKRIQRGISLFKFPRNPKLCQAWLRCLGRTDLYDFSYEDLKNGGFRVCQKHFPPSSMYVKENKTYLRKGALPSVQQTSTPADILKDSPFDYLYNSEELDFTEHPSVQDQVTATFNDISSHALQKVKKADDSPLKEVSILRFCCVPMCSNNSKHHTHLAFHPFPGDNPEMTKVKSLWQRFFKTVLSLWGVKVALPQRHKLLICSVHFQAYEFLVAPKTGVPGDQVKLKPTAVPTVDPLFESYLTARRKMLEDAIPALKTTSHGSTQSAADNTPQPVKPSVDNKRNVTAVSSHAKNAQPKSQSVKDVPSTSQDPLPIPLPVRKDGCLKMPISPLPRHRRSTEASGSPSTYYLVPVVCPSQKNSQPLILVPADNLAKNASQTQPQTTKKRAFVPVPLVGSKPVKLQKVSSTVSTVQPASTSAGVVPVVTESLSKPTDGVKTVVVVNSVKGLKLRAPQMQQTFSKSRPIVLSPSSSTQIASAGAEIQSNSLPLTLTIGPASKLVTNTSTFVNLHAACPRIEGKPVQPKTKQPVEIQRAEMKVCTYQPGDVLSGKPTSTTVAATVAPTSSVAMTSSCRLKTFFVTTVSAGKQGESRAAQIASGHNSSTQTLSSTTNTNTPDNSAARLSVAVGNSAMQQQTNGLFQFVCPVSARKSAKTTGQRVAEKQANVVNAMNTRCNDTDVSQARSNEMTSKFSSSVCRDPVLCTEEMEVDEMKVIASTSPKTSISSSAANVVVDSVSSVLPDYLLTSQAMDIKLGNIGDRVNDVDCSSAVVPDTLLAGETVTVQTTESPDFVMSDLPGAETSSLAECDGASADEATNLDEYFLSPEEVEYKPVIIA